MTESLIRQEKNIHILFETHTALVTELAAQLDVSTWTIRRDLDLLEERKLVERYYGGVKLVDMTGFPRNDYDNNEQAASTQKQHIGQAAARLLLADQYIVMGAGTTTMQVARQLQSRKYLQIMTNSLNIAIELSQNPALHVISTGGSVDSDYYSLTGTVAERALRDHFFDVAVIGVSGISADVGLTVSSQSNAVVLNAMIEQSRKCIVVADSSKFGQLAFAQLVPFSKIDVLVSDTRPSHDIHEALRAHRVKVVLPN